MKSREIIFTTIVSLLVCFAFSPQTRAACDSPDPGCAGANLAEGYLALQNLTTGVYNTGIGTYSLLSITDGSLCTGVGAGTLFSNTASENTATGAGALFSNSTGGFNTADGTFALFSNSTGTANVAIGELALSNNDANFNTVVGYQAGQNLTLSTSSENIYIGDSAGTFDNTGAPPGDEDGVIRIGSVFSGTAACFINGIGTNPQVWNGVTVCQVTVNGFGQLGVDCVNPSNPGATPQGQGKSAPAQHQAMLNHKVEKLEATVAILIATVKEQGAQIQKVNAQLEASKPAPHVVNNP